MKKVGIICEYDPFHNGHIYHLEKIKEKYPDSLIILVMSGNFTERGNISILNKWEKTNIALNHNIDLVIELPFIFATQSADIFAKGAISILKELKTDYLVFGSETGNTSYLTDIAKLQLEDPNYQLKVKDYLKQGLNYPTALARSVKDFINKDITEPNDLLGLSYIKEIIRQNASITPDTIKRTNNFHDDKLTNNIVSAKAIRYAKESNKNIKDYVPSDTYNYLNKKKIPEYFNYLKYKILNEQENIKNYQTVDEGIENRIISVIDKSNSLEELIQNIKTKRYTYNKIKRMTTHILTSFTKEEAKNNDLKYIRVLGFNSIGKKYLNEIKKDITIPLITNVTKKDEELLNLDIRCDKIYSLITNEDINSYKNKPIIKN